MPFGDYVKTVKGLFNGVGGVFDYETLVAVLNEALPDGVAALVTKNENLGSLIGFTAHLSQDLTEAQLQDVFDAVESHPAITGVITFPYEIVDQDFTLAGDPDDTVTSITGNTGQNALPLTLGELGSPNTADFEWQVSATAQAFGGSGGALRLTDLKTAANIPGIGHAMDGNIQIAPGNHGITAWRGFEIQYQVAFGAGGDGAVNQQSRSYGMLQGSAAGLNAGLVLDAGAGLRVHAGNASLASPVTPVAETYNEIKIQVLQNAISGYDVSVFIDDMNTAVLSDTGAGGPVPSLDTIKLHFYSFDDDATMGAVLQRPILVDDFQFTYILGDI